MRIVFHRRAWLIVVAITAMIAATVALVLELPLRDDDRQRAAQSIVAWIVQGQRIPGFSEEYPDAQLMKKQRQFFVFCDFQNSHRPISNDVRVHVVARKDFDNLFKEHSYNVTDYIVIELKSSSRRRITLELENQFGGLGGHGYTFEFRRKLWGLIGHGELEWVS
jgi:hypothetical protein